MIRRLDREGNGLPAPPVLAGPPTEARSHGELTYCQPGLKQEVVADRLALSFGTYRRHLRAARAPGALVAQHLAPSFTIAEQAVLRGVALGGSAGRLRKPTPVGLAR
jgi:hypothetical protein